MMEWVEDHNKIPDECFGSQRGRSAVNAAINWELSLDLMQQKQIPGMIMAAAVEQCYDRLAHSMVLICSQ